MARINPILLIHFREKAKLSQQDLSRLSKIDKGTIFRIESNKMKRSNSERVILGLAKALKVESEQLTAAEAEGLPTAVEDAIFPRSQLNVRVSPEIRNALALVASRYGVKAIDVIEFAPLLFHLAASESLKERSTRLAELGAARDAISALNGRFGHLTERLLNDWQGEEIERLEERSIASRDLRGAGIDAGDLTDDPRPLKYDEDEGNPFVLHLRERLTNVQDAGSRERLDGWYKSVGVQYEICHQDALAWFDGDQDAADDLVGGRFSVTDMPREVRGGNATDRIEWVCAKRAETSARAAEYFTALGLGDLL